MKKFSFYNDKGHIKSFSMEFEYKIKKLCMSKPLILYLEVTK